MKRFLVGLMLISFLVSTEPQKEEVGRYKMEVTTYISPKNGKLYVLETTFDTKTGKVVDRKRFYYTKYKRVKNKR